LLRRLLPTHPSATENKQPLPYEDSLLDDFGAQFIRLRCITHPFRRMIIRFARMLIRRKTMAIRFGRIAAQFGRMAAQFGRMLIHFGRMKSRRIWTAIRSRWIIIQQRRIVGTWLAMSAATTLRQPNSHRIRFRIPY